MWDALFAEGDIFYGEGPCRHWSEGSRKKRRQGYGQWLSFLMRTEPQALEEPPGERAIQSRVRAYLEECEVRLQPKSVAGLIADLCTVAAAIAPDRGWDWLNRTFYRLQARADRRALPAPHPVTAKKIFQWSLKRLQDVEASDLPALRKAIHFRQALMIGFMIARPVRRRTLLCMLVSQHVHRRQWGFDLHFRAEDMKDGRARSFRLPEALCMPMQIYLDHHRPVLLGDQPSDALWVSQYGCALTPDGFSRELPKVTERHIGVPLRPHAFRNIAATSIAEFDPEHVNIIRDIVGHATLDMAEKHYNRATGISSCNGLQSIVEDILKDVPIMARAKRRSPRSAPAASRAKERP